jgi:hypothetical protein
MGSDTLDILNYCVILLSDFNVALFDLESHNHREVMGSDASRSLVHIDALIFTATGVSFTLVLPELIYLSIGHVDDIIRIIFSILLIT